MAGISDRAGINMLIVGVLVGILGYLCNRQFESFDREISQIKNAQSAQESILTHLRLEFAAFKNFKKY